jgi:hypothetical protein
MLGVKQIWARRVHFFFILKKRAPRKGVIPGVADINVDQLRGKMARVGKQKSHCLFL